VQRAARVQAQYAGEAEYAHDFDLGNTRSPLNMIREIQQHQPQRVPWRCVPSPGVPWKVEGWVEGLASVGMPSWVAASARGLTLAVLLAPALCWLVDWMNTLEIVFIVLFVTLMVIVGTGASIVRCVGVDPMEAMAPSTR